ncbi:hypothetical protein O9992_30415 [Vibrio lentus]|nr:hypothetical protein [Vibrio lentus]
MLYLLWWFTTAVRKFFIIPPFIVNPFIRILCDGAFIGLITVVLLAKWADQDKGLAAGLAAGGLTQSAIIGTAGNVD